MSLHLTVMANIQSSIVFYRCSAEVLSSCWRGHELKMGIPNLTSVCEKLYVIQNSYCLRHTDLSQKVSPLAALECVCACRYVCCFCVCVCQNVYSNQSHKGHHRPQTTLVQSSALEGWLISRFVLNINSHLHRHQSHKATEFRTPRTRLAE